MDWKAKAHEYNAELKEALSLWWSITNNGQRKQILKNARLRHLLEKYHVIDGDEDK